MKRLMTKDGSDYRTFGVFLKRKGINNSYCLASLLIDKFIFSKQESCYSIDCDELTQKNILPCEKHKTFGHWRDEMIKKGVLVCMASKDELKEIKPNYKANKFNAGPLIKKHLDKITMKNMPDKFKEIVCRVETVENKMGRVENKIEEFDERFDKMISMLLKVAPPDSEVRRKIIKENFMDNERCFELLSDETKQWILDNDANDLGVIEEKDKN